MFTIKFSLALVHGRHLQSPQACTYFMPFFLQEHVIDPHVFLEAILHIHRTTFNVKFWAAFCFYCFQASLTMLPTRIKWVKTFQIQLLPLRNLQVHSKCVIVSGIFSDIFSWKKIFRVHVLTKHHCFVPFYVTQRSPSIIMFPIVPKIM